MIYYTIYKTTCLINDKIYVGVHKTNDPYDNYLGSGISFERAVKKHGRENFTKEILAFCEDEKQAYWVESLLVDEAFIKRRDNYNTKIGGMGGDTFSGRKHSPETIAKMSAVKKGKKVSEEARKNMSKAKKGSHIDRGFTFELFGPNGEYHRISGRGLQRYIEEKFPDRNWLIMQRSYKRNGYVLPRGVWKGWYCLRTST